jgi:thiol-disulfide isomerase/thioredoxin
MTHPSRRTTLFIFFAVLSACIAEEHSNDFYAGTSVRSITSPAEFDSILSDPSPVLVEVFAPWCAACKSLKPSIIELASRLKGSVQIVSVDATVATNSEIVDRLDANSFPTFRFFPRGKQSVVPLNFRASTDVDDMNLWLSNQIAPLWRSVSSLSALQESVDPRLVFAVFHGDVTLRDSISATADIMRQQVAFFETNQPASFGMPEHASLALFTITFDESPRLGVIPVAILDLRKSHTASELHHLISINSVPLVVYFALLFISLHWHRHLIFSQFRTN